MLYKALTDVGYITIDESRIIVDPAVWGGQWPFTFYRGEQITRVPERHVHRAAMWSPDSWPTIGQHLRLLAYYPLAGDEMYQVLTDYLRAVYAEDCDNGAVLIPQSLIYRSRAAGFPEFDWLPAIETAVNSHFRNYGSGWGCYSAAPAITDDIIAIAEASGAPWVGAGSARVDQAERQAAEIDAIVREKADKADSSDLFTFFMPDVGIIQKYDPLLDVVRKNADSDLMETLDPLGLVEGQVIALDQTVQNFNEGNYLDPAGAVESFMGGDVQPIDYLAQGRELAESDYIEVGRWVGRIFAFWAAWIAVGASAGEAAAAADAAAAGETVGVAGEGLALEGAAGDALAVSWEGALAESSVQNMALAEIAGEAVPGTLATAIGEEAASVALADAAEVYGAELLSLPIEEVAAGELPAGIPAAEIPAGVKSTLYKTAAGELYRYLRKELTPDAPLVPRQVGRELPNGELEFFDEPRKPLGILPIALAAGALGLVVDTDWKG